MDMKRFFCLFVSVFLFLSFFCGCGSEFSLLDYVSENRLDILTGSKDGYLLTVYFTEKESPYLADGIKAEINRLAEFTLTAPDNTATYTLSATVNGTLYEGEFSYSAQKNNFNLTLPMDFTDVRSLTCTVLEGKTAHEIVCESVKEESVLSYREILGFLERAEAERIDSLKEKNVFRGEIYVRLLYDDGCYYYVGIIDRNGGVYALLFDAADGKILATRE